MGFDTRASARQYVRQDDDTLDAIAQRETEAGNEMTSQELAKFNFGTDDPNAVNEYLRDDLGTRKRDADNNFVILADDDGPGELLIPRRFTRNALAVNKTHTLRVAKKTSSPQFLACHSVPGVTFAFDRSYLRISVVDELVQLELAAQKHPDAKIMVFGHADKVGDDVYNKALSERRAKSVYSFIVNDADAWESLYNEENWGVRVVQDILKELGHDPGPIDGVMGPKTRDGMRSFLGLPAGSPVSNDAAFRKKLFTAYMTSTHDVRLTPDRFMEPRYMGCSEFNPEKDTEAAHEPNRRVMFYLFNKDRLPKLPCKYGDIRNCQKQMNPPAPRFRKPFKCSYYDSLTRDCKCEKIPPSEIGQIKISSPRIEDSKRVSHGAAVVLNDDHDCGQLYGAAPPAGHRELEPIFDLDFLGATPKENDLLEVKLSMALKPRHGEVELKVTEGAARIRVWPRSTRGPAADVVTLPVIVPQQQLPKKFYVEGLQTGRAVLEATCTHPGGTSSEQLVINVVQMIERQGGNRRIIYDYNTDIEFKVEGAPANYTFEWDLDGDGNFNTAVFEQANTTDTATCKYGPAESATTVRLDQTAANTRRVYDVAVRLTGGLIVHVKGTTFEGTAVRRGIRVALATNQGQPLPAKSTAGLHTLHHWSDTSPVVFNATDAAHSGANRISYNATETANASTPYWGMGAGREVRYVEVGPGIWNNGQTRESLNATVNHEIVHLRQHVAVRDNSPANNVWRLLDDHYGSGPAYSDFRETLGHFSELLDRNVSWFHYTNPDFTLPPPRPQGDLELFTRRYNRALGLYNALPAGAAKTAAKQLLQGVYRQIPFFEMKRSEYQNFVRAPQ